MADIKAELIGALDKLNTAVLDKLAGLSDYDQRRPMTDTGTNLLGIVKHLASVQAGYFGDTFGRPWPEPMPWLDESAAINDDMFASADESADWVLDFYRRSWIHANETFAVTELGAEGTVPWWPEERRHPTLHTVLIHMTVETARHAGHLDIVRELIDGAAGRFVDDPSMPGEAEVDWPAYVAKVDDVARSASGQSDQ